MAAVTGSSTKSDLHQHTPHAPPHALLTEHLDTSAGPSTNTSPVRGRKRRRHSALSQSPNRSPSPSRGHERSSASRYRDERRSRFEQLVGSEDTESSSDFLKLPSFGKGQKRLRRRSDLGPDHNLRGRPRHRSPSAEKAIAESTSEDEMDGDTSESQKENYSLHNGGKSKVKKKRSSPPSRGRTTGSTNGPDSPVLRRQRSLPNQYKKLNSSSKFDAASLSGTAV